MAVDSLGRVSISHHRSQQRPLVVATTKALPQPRHQDATGFELMIAMAQSVQPLGLGFLGGYWNDLYFDHWFDGEHP